VQMEHPLTNTESGKFRNDIATSNAVLRDTIAHFEVKTHAILRRYGPGPRVHYHTGMVDDPPPSQASAHDLRQRLVAAQERILRHAADTWSASATLNGEVLDVGCGLGGGAIFWAEEFGARVTAVTCVPSHVNLVARYARLASVASRVFPLLCDALEIPGENRFDAAVAVDSSCYLPRKKLFRRLASLVRPGGTVFIIDCFLGRIEYQEPFDRHWHTRIGTIDEYLAAAREAGLQAGSVEDISRHTLHFWTTTLALIQAEMQESDIGPVEMARREASRGAHALVRQGFADGGLRYALMSFSKAEAQERAGPPSG
jgi:cyclopropane fatty-acyl-phospholipid synthase-like methyltransferase